MIASSRVRQQSWVMWQGMPFWEDSLYYSYNLYCVGGGGGNASGTPSSLIMAALSYCKVR